MGEHINKTNKTNKNNKYNKTNKTNKIGNVVHLDEIANGFTSARPREAVRVDPLSFISEETSLDASQEKSGYRECEFRDYEKEIKEYTWNSQLDVTWAKLSIFKQKSNRIQLALHYVNQSAFGPNKIQHVLFAMTDVKKDFLGNLDHVWGPDTKLRPLYATLATGLKSGVLEQIGKGRPAKNYGTHSTRLAPLYAESVAYIKHNHTDNEWCVGVAHHGFEQFFYFNNLNFDIEDLKQPVATKEYRRSIEYGY